MEDPEKEIPKIIHLLTQSPPTVQQLTLEKYFAPNASFTHPFCRTGSFDYSHTFLGHKGTSRWLIGAIYRWYKIISPTIELEVDSVAFDTKKLVLYVSLHQKVRLWIVPGYVAPVELVTVLHLAEEFDSGTPTRASKFLISKQEDLYQSTECIKFFSFFRVSYFLAILTQYLATMICVMGQRALEPVSWWMDGPGMSVAIGNGNLKLRESSENE